MHPPPPAPSPVHRLDLRVYAADTDASGIVHHAQYFVFAERARSEFLREHGLAVETIGATDDGFWIVRRATVAYRAPARLDDLLTVASRVTAARGASCDLDQHVLRGGDTLVEIAITVAFLDAAGRPRRADAAWRAGLARLVGAAW